MSEIQQPTSDHLKAHEGYEDQSIITGNKTALLLTELMKGSDLETAVATLTAGSAGHPAERIASFAHLRSEMQKIRLTRVESSFDDQGNNGLKCFEDIISHKVSERLISNIEKAEKQRLGYHATLVTRLMDNPEGEDADYTRRDLQRLFDGKVIQPESLAFITGYKSSHSDAVMIDSEGNFVRDNDLLSAAIEEAANSDFGAFDEELYDALDGLLPNKMFVSVSADGIVRIDVDGSELEINITD